MSDALVTVNFLIFYWKVGLTLISSQLFFAANGSRIKFGFIKGIFILFFLAESDLLQLRRLVFPFFVVGNGFTKVFLSFY